VAQDVIVFEDGSEIQAIVQEVGTEYVKYKKFDNQTGPIYNKAISEIFMIQYENGTKDVMNEITQQSEKQKEQSEKPAPVEGKQQQIVQQDLPVYKNSWGSPINPIGSKKSPFLAGLLSFIIPGVGQFYDEDIASGFTWMGLNIISNTLWMSAKSTNSLSYVLGMGMATFTMVYSTLDAYSMAKTVNLARGYNLGKNVYLKAEPALLKTNYLSQKSLSNNTLGISLKLSFE